MNWSGRKLKVLCDKAGLSPSILAERMGVSRPTLYSWLSGRDPRGSQLLRLSDVLRIKPEALYDRNDENLKLEDIERKQVRGGVKGGGSRLFQKSGIKLVYTILSDPLFSGSDPLESRLNSSIRDIAKYSGLSAGSVSELLGELKDRGFLLTEGRVRILVNRKTLFDYWKHGYIEYRIRKKCLCFETESTRWWSSRSPEREGFLWGGEPAASVFTRGYLSPERLTLYTSRPQYDLVVDANLHQVSSGGNVEFITPLISVEKGVQGCVHPLLVYADLICSGDDRNAETANMIYDECLHKIIESD
jgi:DNA-binding XRE family transcriptional regulator